MSKGSIKHVRSSQRFIRLQTKSLPLCRIRFHAVRVGHVSGELEVATGGIELSFDEGAEVLEESAGGLLSLGLGPVGLGDDGGDLSLDDAFEDVFGRGAGELVEGVFGDADELASDGVAEVLADAGGTISHSSHFTRPREDGFPAIGPC